MAWVFDPDFETNATATPVEYVSTGGGGWDSLATGEWQDEGAAIPVILLPLDTEELLQAGADTDPRDRDLIFNLGGGMPINTTQTLRIDSTAPELADDAGRYDVKSAPAYAVAGFEKVGFARVRRK